jgi:ribose-phosphate pyrophosphokinase
MPVDRDPLLLAVADDRPFAARVAELAQLPLASIEERAFEGGELKLRPLDSVRDRSVVVIASLAGNAALPAGQKLVRLCFLLSVLRDNGAMHRTALIPYLAFARKDRRTQLRDPVNTRYVATLLEAAGLDRLLAIDVHDAAAIENAYRVPFDHLSAAPMFAAHLSARLQNQRCVVVSPDVGGIKRAQRFCDQLGARLGTEVDMAFIAKRRAAGKVSDSGLVGEVTGRAAIVIDDLCASGQTLIRAATALRAAGAARMVAIVTHAPTDEGIAAVVASGACDRIVTTNTVPVPPGEHGAQDARLEVLDVAPLFATALRRIRRGEPLAPLLDTWPID